uniref:F-box domain-containing protein n=1 Tax=Triticum aestivum TaxID=4565 RepID=A0A3B5Z5Q9_WHEAT
MEPSEASPGVTTLDSLKDKNIEDILLRLPSPASLGRAALASRRWRGIASSPPFLRRFRELHPWSPVLGLFVTHADLDQLPVFHPAAAVRSDRDLAAAARGGDFLLTHLEHDPAWRLRDFRNGRLLLCRGDSVSVYNPVSISHRHVAVPRPPNGALPEPEYISDCLLDLGGHGDGEGGAPCCFRVVTVQQERDGQRMRAMEYNSCTSGWRVHPWVDVDGIDIGVDVPAKRMRRPMHAAAAGLIFWRYDLNSSLLLDTSTMVFSIVLLPVPRPRVYAIADTDAGACCFLNIVGATMLQVWVLKKKGGGNGRAWELEKQSQIGELASLNRSCDVHMVAAGLAIVYCVSSKYSHIVIDLKDLSLKDKFRCHRCMAFPFQMPWPPAGLVATSTCERSIPQAYACRDAASQHEAPPSSRKRTSNDEMATGKETMEPCIFIASFKNESREKKFCYEIGPPS